MPEQCCDGCRYWDPPESPKHLTGFCLRYPPQMVVFKLSSGEEQATEVWPETMPNDWCGEHMPLPVAEELKQADKREPLHSEAGRERLEEWANEQRVAEQVEAEKLGKRLRVMPIQGLPRPEIIDVQGAD